ncbi:MAG: CHAT domain-containing protein [Anaerolineae bacterium]|nr:CHAT domain-containing protein [Anaerolineae bacterium]
MWAVFQSLIGELLLQNPVGNRAENIEQAIVAYQQALTVMTQSAMPVEWATTMMNLATAYYSRLGGDKAENIEQAIAAYQQALTVRTQSAMPVEWAQTLYNLATAYYSRVGGDKAENIEQAIAAYQQALTVITQSAMPVEWAQILNNLATAYYTRIGGDRAENIEQAIIAYQQALAVMTQSAMPVEWAQIQFNLATAYCNRIHGDRAENIEQAIAAYQEALTIRTQSAMPVDWAQTLNNLATAYQDRIHGDKAENIELAIAACQQALTVTTKAAMPSDWAQTVMNLGIALQNRIHGDKAKNIELAIVAYQEALTIRTQSAMPVDWATTMMNLVTAYQTRIYSDRAENLEQAIAAYQQVLTVKTQAAMPVDWATTMMNLANAYCDRIRGDKAENIEQAIVAYQQALTVKTQAAMPFEWARTLNNLATAYQNRIHGDRVENLEQAIAAYQQALTVRTQSTMPVEYSQTLSNLGALHFDERRWAEASEMYSNVIDAGKSLLSQAATDAGRQHNVKESALAYVRSAYCALRLGQPSAALERLEAGKTRLQEEAFALDDTNLLRLSEGQRGQIRIARAHIRALEAEYRLPEDHPQRREELELTAALRAAREELQAIIDAVRVEQPDFMPEDLALPEILALIPPESALVAPLFTSQGSGVFIVPHGAQNVITDHVIMLDDFTDGDAARLLIGTEGDPGWLRGYLEGDVEETLDIITRRLWDDLIETIDARLQALGVKRVLFMPQGGLGLLPVHAAWREVEGQRRYFMDDYTITYAPSAYALQAATKRAANQKDKNALIAGVSHYPEPMSDLPNTASEARAIADLFGVSPLLDGQVAVAAVNALSSSANYLHLACHGSFAWGGDTYQAGLFLHNGELLTMGEIMGRLDLNQTRLVTLSACETGITDIRKAPDEFLGLSAAFIQAGASAVVSSLWTVEDRSTALLMEKMYQLMLDKDHPLEPAVALREAQFWLRSNPAYAHPFYWAAFKIDGV